MLGKVVLATGTAVACEKMVCEKLNMGRCVLEAAPFDVATNSKIPKPISPPAFICDTSKPVAELPDFRDRRAAVLISNSIHKEAK